MNRQDTRGQSLVEFALVIPIVLLLMLGLFDLGRIVFVRNGLSDGARQAAREATIDPRDPEYCSRIEAAARTAIRDLPLADFEVEYWEVNLDGTSTSVGVLCDWQAGTLSPTVVVLPLTSHPGDRIQTRLTADLSLATPIVSSAAGAAGFVIETNSAMNVTFVPAP